jgi:hypothetical protein
MGFDEWNRQGRRELDDAIGGLIREQLRQALIDLEHERGIVRRLEGELAILRAQLASRPPGR